MAADRGERGPTGDRGQAGDAGLIGPKGVQGERGEAGKRGRASSVLVGLLGTYVLLTVTAVLLLGLNGRVGGNAATIGQTRAEQCRVLDADHNRERAAVLFSNSQILHSNPKGLQFGGRFYSAQEIYDQAKDAYEAPRKTRPPYCDKYRKNPVAPYPSLKALRG